MADEKSVSEKLDAIFDAFTKRMDASDARLDAACSRMDSMAKKDADKEETEAKAKKDAAEAEEKAKKDAAEKEEVEAKAKKDADEKEAGEKAKKDAADEQARKDTAARTLPPEIIERLAALERNAPAMLTGEARKPFTAAQFKAEAVYQAFGDSAGAPASLNGEALPDYQRRLLSRFKSHSPKWKEKDLSKVDASVLDIAEEQIYADAMSAAMSPTSAPAGGLREIKKTDAAGRVISTFVGSETACWAPYGNAIRRGKVIRSPQQH